MKIRDEALIDFIQANQISDQAAFVALLEESGYNITQASLSRRLKKLNVEKKDGWYQMPKTSLPVLQMPHSVKSIQTAPPNMIVIRTQPGCANQIAYQLDLIIDKQAELPSVTPYQGMSGTVAGDDTIFVVISGTQYLESVFQALESDYLE